MVIRIQGRFNVVLKNEKNIQIRTIGTDISLNRALELVIMAASEGILPGEKVELEKL